MASTNNPATNLATSIESTPTPKEASKEVTQEEVLFLVAQYLARCTPCHATAKLLEEEAAAHKLLGSVSSWDGSVQNATMKDWTKRNSEISGKHLMDRLSQAMSLESSDKSIVSAQKQDQTEIDRFCRKLVETNIQKRTMQHELKQLHQFLTFSSNSQDQSQELRKVTGEKRKEELEAKLPKLESALEAMRRDKLTRRGNAVLELADRKVVPLRNLYSYTSALRLNGKLKGKSASRFAANNEYSRFQLRHSILGHINSTYCLTIDKEGRWAATGSDDKVIKVWNLRTGMLHATFRGHAAEVCDVRLDADDRVLASASAEAIRLWDFHSGRQLAVIRRHKQPIFMLSFDKNDRVLTSISDDGSCCIWDLRDLQVTPTADDVSALDRQVEELSRGLPQRDNQTIETEVDQVQPIIGSVEDEVDDSIVSQNLPLPIVLPHVDENMGCISQVNYVAVHPNGGFVVTGSSDGIGRIWKIALESDTRCRSTPNAQSVPKIIKGAYKDGANRLVSVLRGHVQGIDWVGWSHGGDRVLTVAKDSTARVWSWDHHRSKVSDSRQTSMFFNAPRQIVLSVISHGTAAPKRGRGGNSRRPTLDSAAWNLDDRYVLTHQSRMPKSGEEQNGYWDQQFKVWDSRTGQLLHLLRGHRMMASSIVPHHVYPHITITAGDDGQLCVWDIEQGKLLNVSMLVTPTGISRILDCRYTPQGSGPHEMVAVDNFGNLLFMGTSEESVFEGAPTQQFFQSDYEPLDRDSRGFVVDQVTQRPPHMRLPGPLCDMSLTAYPTQPQSASLAQYIELANGQASEVEWNPQLVERNFRMRVTLHRAFKREFEISKENVLRHFSAIHERQNQLMREAQEQDKVDLALRDGQVGANTTSGRFVQLAGPRNTITAGVRNRLANSDVTRATTGLLACEREAMDESSSDESASEDDESTGPNDGLQPRINGGELDASNVLIGERKTRRAAKKAVRMVRKYKDKYYGDGASAANESEDDEYKYSKHNEDDEVKEAWVPQRKSGRSQLRKSYTFSDEESSEEEEYVSDGVDEVAKPKIAKQKQSAQSARARKKAKRAAKQRKRQQKIKDRSLAMLQDRMQVVFDREPLQRITCPGASGNYIPQFGDRVVYFVQGHLEYLKNFPSSELPPWQKIRAWSMTEAPVVLCEVTGIEYTFPDNLIPQPQDGKVPICCVITLGILGVGKSSDSEGVAWDTTMLGTFGENAFTFTFHAQQIVSEFLIPLKRFENSLAKRIERNDSVNVAYADANGADEFYKAIVEHVSPCDTRFPDSPWEAVLVKFEGGEDASRVSPWELTMSRNPDSASAIHCWTRLSSIDKPTIETIVKNLKELIESQPEYFANFAYPVSLEQIPEYGAMIPLPMDLELIQERLRSGYYRQVEAIMFDIKLIRDNCYVYNIEGSEICVQADRMLSECMKMFRTTVKLSKVQKRLAIKLTPTSDELSDTEQLVEPISEEQLEEVMIRILDTVETVCAEDTNMLAIKQEIAQIRDDVEQRVYMPKRKGKRKARHSEQIPHGCIGVDECTELFCSFSTALSELLKKVSEDDNVHTIVKKVELEATEALQLANWKFHDGDSNKITNGQTSNDDSENMIGDVSGSAANTQTGKAQSNSTAGSNNPTASEIQNENNSSKVEGGLKLVIKKPVASDNNTRKRRLEEADSDSNEGVNNRNVKRSSGWTRRVTSSRRTSNTSQRRVNSSANESDDEQDEYLEDSESDKEEDSGSDYEEVAKHKSRKTSRAKQATVARGTRRSGRNR